MPRGLRAVSYTHLDVYKRQVVNSVESFVGQNITELAGFSAVGKVSQLKELFELYNTRWIAKVGTPGIRIIVK